MVLLYFCDQNNQLDNRRHDKIHNIKNERFDFLEPLPHFPINYFNKRCTQIFLKMSCLLLSEGSLNYLPPTLGFQLNYNIPDSQLACCKTHTKKKEKHVSGLNKKKKSLKPTTSTHNLFLPLYNNAH